MLHRLGLTVLLAAIAATIPASASAATNLGAVWHLDESAGATAADSSGNANNGTLNGPDRISGPFGRALYFDINGDDNVKIPRSATMEPANVTVEAWVRESSTPGAFKYIVSQGASSCAAGGAYGLYTGGGGGLAFYVSGGAAQQFAISPEATRAVWDGTWHHVAGTYDGSAVRLYVDGTEVGNGTAANFAIGYALPTVGGLLGAFGGPGCSFGYIGGLDEPRIWRRALSGPEVAASAAMGASLATRLTEKVDATQAIVYTTDFSGGTAIKISTASSTGTEKITAIKLVGLIPLTTKATCNTGLLFLLNSSCDYELSNGDRTAKLTVRPLLGHPTVTLRVGVSSGRTFDVNVST